MPKVKIPEPDVKVTKAGSLGEEDVLTGTCGICGCEVETKRKHTLLMRAPKTQDSVLCLGVQCPTEGCGNWIVCAKAPE